MFLGKAKEILDAELWAISETLAIAKKTVNVGNTPIKIFCDSQKVLKALRFPLRIKKTDFFKEVLYIKRPENFNVMDTSSISNGSQVIQVS